MTVAEMAKGILRLSPSTRRRLERHLSRLLRDTRAAKRTARKPISKYSVRCDPIYYTWRARLDTLSPSERAELWRLILAQSPELLNAKRPFAIHDLSNLAFEDFLEARRAIWQGVNEEEE
ncbi:MAG: hypothetical protein WHS44_10470 [Fimbriimonadales bacterium]